MTIHLTGKVSEHLRRAALLQEGGGLSDGQLLGLFIENQDELAFEAMMRRHGAMVFGVCTRVLRSSHDADDAFQATFLVLLRKARSIVPREMLGNWLYGVAYLTAIKARALVVKRRARELQVEKMPEPEAAERDISPDLRPLLDRELSRLPEKYRLPIVLCDLEGRPHKEVARRLGWPEGTVSGRLTRGRRLLAGRLTRYGLVLTGGTVALALSQAASACPPTSLLSETRSAARALVAGRAVAHQVFPAKVVALADTVLKSMLLTRLKAITGVVLLVALGWYGFGSFGHSASAGGRGQPGIPGTQDAAPSLVKQEPNSLALDVIVEQVDEVTRRITVRAVFAQSQTENSSFLEGVLDGRSINDNEVTGVPAGGTVKLLQEGAKPQRYEHLLVKHNAPIKRGMKTIPLRDLTPGMRVTLNVTAGAGGLSVLSIRGDSEPARDTDRAHPQ
jgi:RNA polymerase sigma factor (sigma-70 family)